MLSIAAPGRSCMPEPDIELLDGPAMVGVDEESPRDDDACARGAVEVDFVALSRAASRCWTRSRRAASSAWRSASRALRSCSSASFCALQRSWRFRFVSSSPPGGWASIAGDDKGDDAAGGPKRLPQSETSSADRATTVGLVGEAGWTEPVRTWGDEAVFTVVAVGRTGNALGAGAVEGCVVDVVEVAGR